MFVPRALRLKGVKPRAATTTPRKTIASLTIDDAQQVSAPVTDTTSSNIVNKPAASRPQPTNKSVTPEYLSQLLIGIELIFTDYAHQDEEDSIWLEKRYRTVDGEQKFIHLSAVLEHQNVALLKPTVTQLLLQQALQAEPPSATLELSKDGHFVRRRPSTYPLHFIPKDAMSVVDDEGLNFWDARTIYIEPHTRDLCKFPAKVAWWLNNHGQMRDKWLPIQAVKTLYNSCAFVVLSGNVTHEKIWQKWRDKAVPENWKVLSKVEHTKRTNEYLELLRKDNPRMIARMNPKAINEGTKFKTAKRTTASKTSNDLSLVPIRKKISTVETQAEPKGSNVVDEEDPAVVPSAIENKKKRKRRKKSNKSTKQNDPADNSELGRPDQDDAEADVDDPAPQPITKQAKLSHRSNNASSQDEAGVTRQADNKSRQPSKTSFKGSKITFDD